jgi:hypothetical protein
VSASGNDSNDGLSWGTAKLTVGTALAILSACTTNDNKRTARAFTCGKIYVGKGIFFSKSGLSISSHGMSLVGQGGGVTVFTYTGTGCAITLNPFSGLGAGAGNSLGGLFEEFSIDGTGNTNANSCGLSYLDLSEIILRDVQIESRGCGANPGTNCGHLRTQCRPYPSDFRFPQELANRRSTPRISRTHQRETAQRLGLTVAAVKSTGFSCKTLAPAATRTKT